MNLHEQCKKSISNRRRRSRRYRVIDLIFVSRSHAGVGTIHAHVCCSLSSERELVGQGRYVKEKCLIQGINLGVVSQINHQATTAPAPSDRYTRGFLTGRPRVFSLFMALTYAMTSPTWPL